MIIYSAATMQRNSNSADIDNITKVNDTSYQYQLLIKTIIVFAFIIASISMIVPVLMALKRKINIFQCVFEVLLAILMCLSIGVTSKFYYIKSSTGVNSDDDSANKNDQVDDTRNTLQIFIVVLLAVLAALFMTYGILLWFTNIFKTPEVSIS